MPSDVSSKVIVWSPSASNGDKKNVVWPVLFSWVEGSNVEGLPSSTMYCDTGAPSSARKRT